MSQWPFVDFYLILGIDPSATPKEVSAAYLSLARKLHPDSSAARAGSVDQFKAVAEAYETLSDPAKRRAYDKRRRSQKSSPSLGNRPAPVRRSPQPQASAKPGGGVAGSQFFDVFSKIFAGSADRPGASGVVAELLVTPEEARWGATVPLTLTTSRPCGRCRGGGCPHCGGRGAQSQRQSLHVQLAPGSRDGALLRAPGGDCVLRIRIRPCW